MVGKNNCCLTSVRNSFCCSARASYSLLAKQTNKLTVEVDLYTICRRCVGIQHWHCRRYEFGASAWKQLLKDVFVPVKILHPSVNPAPQIPSLHTKHFLWVFLLKWSMNVLVHTLRAKGNGNRNESIHLVVAFENLEAVSWIERKDWTCSCW